MSRNKLTGDFLRSLRRPTKLDELSKSVSKPKGAIPKFGLPKWKLMPLDSKLPSVPGPKDAYYFTCKKLGQQLYSGSKNLDFNLNDPYNNEINYYLYNALHDRYLADYFNKKNNVKCLIDRGFVKNNLDVVCTVKEYNMYRKYLKNLHNDGIKKEMNRRDEIRNDQRVLDRAEAEAKKDIERAKNLAKKSLIREEISREIKRREKEKIRKMKLRALRKEKKIKEIQERKKQHLKEIVVKSRIKSERVRQKRMMLVQKSRKKLINILWQRIKKDRRRKKLRRERKEREEEFKQKTTQDKWQRRYQFQQEQIAKEKQALRLDKKRRDDSIKNYNEKIEKEREQTENKSKKYSKFLKQSARNKNKNCRPIKNKSPGIKSINKNSTNSCLKTDKCKCKNN